MPNTSQIMMFGTILNKGERCYHVCFTDRMVIWKFRLPIGWESMSLRSALIPESLLDTAAGPCWSWCMALVSIRPW